MIEIIIFITVALAFSFWAWRSIRQDISRIRERARQLARPFPPSWREILEKNMPLYQRLDEEQRQRLETLIQHFLIDMSFEGGGGLVIDDEIRVTIAGQACLLSLGRGKFLFRRLHTVVVYPSTFGSYGVQAGEGGGVVEGHHFRLGESWHQGYVVLSWDAVLDGAADVSDGHNVVLHEVAHQIDQADGVTDGFPLIGHPLRYEQWTRILKRDFQRLAKRRELQSNLMDGYGATNQVEFFAVATETFFEKPWILRDHYPELFELLQDFYGLDPSEWTDDTP